MTEKIKVTIHGKEFEVNQKTFRSGKEGFGLYNKIIVVDGEAYRINLNIIETGK